MHLRSPAISSRSSSTRNDNIQYLKIVWCIWLDTVADIKHLKGVIRPGGAQGTHLERRVSEVKDKCENILLLQNSPFHSPLSVHLPPSSTSAFPPWPGKLGEHGGAFTSFQVHLSEHIKGR